MTFTLCDYLKGNTQFSFGESMNDLCKLHRNFNFIFFIYKIEVLSMKFINRIL